MRILVIFLLMMVSASVSDALMRNTLHAGVELVSAVETVQPGVPFLAAVRLKIEEGWHTYWINPGDSGMGLRLLWELPAGFETGPLLWPCPNRYDNPPLVSFGHEGDILFPIVVKPSSTLEAGNSVTLAVRAEWLVCREVCVPGAASLQLELPITDSPARPSSKWAIPLQEALAALPADNPAWAWKAKADATSVMLTVVPPQGRENQIKDALFFPRQPNLIEHAAKQQWVKTDDGFTLTLPRDSSGSLPARIRGVLVLDQGQVLPEAQHALAIDVPLVNTISHRSGKAARIVVAFLCLAGVSAGVLAWRQHKKVPSWDRERRVR